MSMTPRLEVRQVAIGERFFDEYSEKECLPWLKSSQVLAPVKRVKFAREADFETDDEAISKEQKKCWGDVRLAINKFIKDDPTDLVLNFS